MNMSIPYLLLSDSPVFHHKLSEELSTFIGQDSQAR